MPTFIITSPTNRAGEATLCDPGPQGFPDRRTDVPVKVAITETTVRLDDEPHPRSIISSTGLNGCATYLVDGSSAGLHNREHRAALAQAYAVFEQLMACLRPLKDTSERPGLITDAAGGLYDWFRCERERLTAVPHTALERGRDDEHAD